MIGRIYKVTSCFDRLLAFFSFFFFFSLAAFFGSFFAAFLDAVSSREWSGAGGDAEERGSGCLGAVACPASCRPGGGEDIAGAGFSSGVRLGSASFVCAAEWSQGRGAVVGGSSLSAALSDRPRSDGRAAAGG
jgi:hypothetical protein